MFGIGMQELLLIAIVILLFFGGKKIPELMKGLGKGVRSFKDGMNGIEDEASLKSDVKKEEKQSAGDEPKQQ
ncbi:MAG: Sec-independent protein translocase TatA [Bacteroides sp. 43_108]|nr:MAG: Sec-independent protein translocase TatA [Bacteroides sp. 43_108]